MGVIVIPIVMIIVSVGFGMGHKSQGHHRKRNPGTSTMSWDTSISDEIRHRRNYKKTSLQGRFIKHAGTVYRVKGNGYNKTLGRYVSAYNENDSLKISESKAFDLVTEEKCSINESGLMGIEGEMLRKIETETFGEGHNYAVNFVDGNLSYCNTREGIFVNVTEEAATEEGQIKYFKTFKKIQECVLNGVEVTADMVVE